MSCSALLKNGRKCRYKGKFEHGGFCGVHKHFAKVLVAQVDSGQDQNTVLLLSAGAALLEIVEKASDHLPRMVELLVSLSNMAMVAETSEDLKKIESDAHELGGFRMQASPKDVQESIRIMLKNKQWQQISNRLSYDFDVLINHDFIDLNLRIEIEKRKRIFQDLLSRFGYSPYLFAGPKPFILRVIH